MSEREASRVVLSYPEGLSDWGREQIDTERYREYFRRTLGTVAVGDRREEFVDVGCCGDSLDVPFRVERVEVAGDSEVGSDPSVADFDADDPAVALVDGTTEIAYATRDGDVEGGWLVQSAAGPEP